MTARVFALEDNRRSASLRVWPAIVCIVVLMAGTGAVSAQQLEDLGEDPFAGYEPVEEDTDPLEIPNRLIFAFNQAADFAIIRPVAYVYREIVPLAVRDAIRNFLRNLRTPVILANDLLQGEMDRAAATTQRFFINSTAGVLGFFDVAADMGLPWHDEDFGQTLGVYGIGEGVYLVLPLLGPSSARDAAGRVVDHFLDPLTYIADDQGKEEWMLYRTALAGVDFRARNIDTLDEIERDSIDFYARIRSLYRQRRKAKIDNAADESSLGPQVSQLGPIANRSSVID